VTQLRRYICLKQPTIKCCNIQFYPFTFARICLPTFSLQFEKLDLVLEKAMVYNVMKEIDIIISHIVTNDTTVKVFCVVFMTNFILI